MKLFVIFFAGLITLCPNSWAELGATSMTSNNGHIRSISTLPSPNPAQYTIKKIITRDDIEIHEYNGLNGLVFAVTWQGETKPDLAPLLGTYLSRYNAALNHPLAGRSPVAINDVDLVIQTGGRMNHFFGLAFLPSLAPQGVLMSEVK